MFGCMDEEGWNGVIPFLWCLVGRRLSLSGMSVKKIGKLIKNHWQACPSPLVVPYPFPSETSEWTVSFYPSNQTWERMSSSLESNTEWDELIPDIRDGSIPSLIDAQPNAPLGDKWMYLGIWEWLIFQCTTICIHCTILANVQGLNCDPTKQNKNPLPWPCFNPFHTWVNHQRPGRIGIKSKVCNEDPN
jgi:hypothetical protein